MWWMLLLACGGSPAPIPEAAPEVPAVEEERPPEGVKVHGNLPVMTESELRAEDEARQACLDACGEAEDAAACESDCHQRHPIVQVEVVPDGLPAPEGAE